MLRIRHRGFLLLAVLILLIELAIATVFKHTILRPGMGDYLVVIMLYSGMRGLTTIRPWKLAIGVFVFALIIETGQLIDLHGWLGIPLNGLTEVVLGTAFDWYDILAYGLGVLTVYLADRWFAK